MTDFCFIPKPSIKYQIRVLQWSTVSFTNLCTSQDQLIRFEMVQLEQHGGWSDNAKTRELMGIATLILICGTSLPISFLFTSNQSCKLLFTCFLQPSLTSLRNLHLFFSLLICHFSSCFIVYSYRGEIIESTPFTLVNKEIFFHADSGVSEATLCLYQKLAFLNLKTLHHMFSSHVFLAG